MLSQIKVKLQQFNIVVVEIIVQIKIMIRANRRLKIRGDCDMIEVLFETENSKVQTLCHQIFFLVSNGRPARVRANIYQNLRSHIDDDANFHFEESYRY